MPGWQVYVSDDGNRTGTTAAAHPPITATDGGRARGAASSSNAAMSEATTLEGVLNGIGPLSWRPWSGPTSSPSVLVDAPHAGPGGYPRPSSPGSCGL